MLVHRFPSTSANANANANAKGLDATSWADNATFTIDGPARFQVQDEYAVIDNAAKWSAILSLLAKAGSTEPQTLFLDYTSGYIRGTLSVPSIPAVADYINPKLTEYFTTSPPARTGVLAMDFVDAPLAKLVFDTNFR